MKAALPNERIVTIASTCRAPSHVFFSSPPFPPVSRSDVALPRFSQGI